VGVTQVRGVYCSYCRRRYVESLCREKMPCEHHLGDLVRDGIRPAATLISCYSWRYSGGFRNFSMQKVVYVRRNGVRVREWVGPEFSVSYMTEKEVERAFLRFLERVGTWEWVAWVEAFTSLIRGGKSSKSVPKWRQRQLRRRNDGL